MQNLPAVHRANDLAIQAIQELQAVNAALEAQIDDLAPKAEAYDLLTSCGETIDMTTAAQLIAEALHLPALGLVRLYRILRAMGIVYKDHHSNYAHQRFIDQGYLKNRVSVKYGRNYVSVQITPKGMGWLVRRISEWLGSDHPLALITYDGQKEAK